MIRTLQASSNLLLTLARNFANYKYPFNINQEEHKSYLLKVQKAEQLVAEAQQRSRVPRRQRRVYDRPKRDYDVTDYSAWRLLDSEDTFNKVWAHGARVLAKVQLQPKWLVHGFGIGQLPINHTKSAHREYTFEDNRLARFLLYEYRNTTFFQPNDPKHDYINQDKLPKTRRKVFRTSPEQFWQSESYFEFRINGSSYAEHLKFKVWITEQVQARKSKQSYDTFIDKKFGKTFTFTKKQDGLLFVPYTPAILSVGPKHYSLSKKAQGAEGKTTKAQKSDKADKTQKREKGDKSDRQYNQDNPKGEKIADPQVHLPQILGENFRIRWKKPSSAATSQPEQKQSKATGSS